MVTGKTTVAICLAWLLFIPGGVYACMFQLAVYNNKTIDLNTQLSARKNVGTSLQYLITGVAFFVPMVLQFTFDALWGPDVTPWILMGIGIVGILLSPLWLKNIYRRFMQRRYKNLEGFRDSRQK